MRWLNNVLFVLVSHRETKQFISTSRDSSQLCNTRFEIFLHLCHALFALSDLSVNLTQLLLCFLILIATRSVVSWDEWQLIKVLTHLSAGNSSLTSSCLSMSNSS